MTTDGRDVQQALGVTIHERDEGQWFAYRGDEMQGPYPSARAAREQHTFAEPHRMVTYVTQAEVARWCGVQRQAVTNWLTRHATWEDGRMIACDFPAPDAVIGNEADAEHSSYGWLPERRAEWEAFAAARRPVRRTEGRRAGSSANARLPNAHSHTTVS